MVITKGSMFLKFITIVSPLTCSLGIIKFLVSLLLVKEQESNLSISATHNPYNFWYKLINLVSSWM